MNAREPVLKCYRAACADAAHPCGYNRITHGLYCLACASEINKYRPDDHDSFFPLLFGQALAMNMSGGEYVPGIILIREQPGINVTPPKETP